MLEFVAIVAGIYIFYEIGGFALKGLFEPSIDQRLTSCVSQINEVGKLKVLRLICGGFIPCHKIYDENNSNTWASASFMYHGMVDIFIDFKEVRVDNRQEDGATKLILKMPPFEPGPVRETPDMVLDSGTKDNVPNLDLVPLYEKRKGDSRLRQKLWQNMEPIRAGCVKKDAMETDNLDRAKHQAENILRAMFASFVEIPERDIIFNWPQNLSLMR